MGKPTSKPRPDNRSTIIKGFVKPTIPGFPGTKAPTNFKPTGRFQSINRSRR
jgi:hypothetical protein